MSILPNIVLIMKTYLANGFSSLIFYQHLKIMHFVIYINYKQWVSTIVFCERSRCFWLFFFSLTRRKRKNKVCTLFTQLLISSRFLILFFCYLGHIFEKSFLELSWRQFPLTMWLSTLQNAHLFPCIALFHWVLCCFFISRFSFFLIQLVYSSISNKKKRMGLKWYTLFWLWLKNNKTCIN